MNNFHLQIISIKEPLFNGEVALVSVPSVNGELTILNGHIPLITNLKKGKIKVRSEKNEEHFFEVQKGCSQNLSHHSIQ